MSRTTGKTDSERQLQELLDRQAIHELIALYCRGLDRVDEATLRSIYHDDAIEDRGAGIFIGSAQEWVTWTMSVLPVFTMTQHCILNCLIDLEGDVAHGETYFQAYHRFGAAEQQDEVMNGHADGNDALRFANVPETDLTWPEGETEMILAGRYLDRFERRNGVWKIAYRKMICDWCRTQPVADDWFQTNPTAYRGRRGIADSRLDSALHHRARF